MQWIWDRRESKVLRMLQGFRPEQKLQNIFKHGEERTDRMREEARREEKSGEEERLKR